MRYVTIKGNPYKYHRKEDGQPAALCGAKPGKGGRAWLMKDRTGWYHYKEEFQPRNPDLICAKCAEIEKGVTTTKT